LQELKEQFVRAQEEHEKHLAERDQALAQALKSREEQVSALTEKEAALTERSLHEQRQQIERLGELVQERVSVK